MVVHGQLLRSQPVGVSQAYPPRQTARERLPRRATRRGHAPVLQALWLGAFIQARASAGHRASTRLRACVIQTSKNTDRKKRNATSSRNAPKSRVSCERSSACATRTPSRVRQRWRPRCEWQSRAASGPSSTGLLRQCPSASMQVRSPLHSWTSARSLEVTLPLSSWSRRTASASTWRPPRSGKPAETPRRSPGGRGSFPAERLPVSVSAGWTTRTRLRHLAQRRS